MQFVDFLFVNPYIPAAFLVAGFFITFKFQYQALLFLLAVSYGCDSFPQFAFYSVVLSVHCLFSGLFRAASDKR